MKILLTLSMVLSSLIAFAGENGLKLGHVKYCEKLEKEHVNKEIHPLNNGYENNNHECIEPVECTVFTQADVDEIGSNLESKTGSAYSADSEGFYLVYPTFSGSVTSNSKVSSEGGIYANYGFTHASLTEAVSDNFTRWKSVSVREIDYIDPELGLVYQVRFNRQNLAREGYIVNHITENVSREEAKACLTLIENRQSELEDGRSTYVNAELIEFIPQEIDECVINDSCPSL